MIAPTEKTVVMIGGFGHEGLSAQLKSLDYGLTELNLDNVLPRTWVKRSETLRSLKKSNKLAACIIYLHSTLLLTACEGLYFEAFKRILEELRGLKTLVFIYQDNLDGVFSMRHAETREPMTLQDLELALEINSTDEGSRSRFRLEGAIERLTKYESMGSVLESCISRPNLRPNVQLPSLYKENRGNLGSRAPQISA